MISSTWYHTCASVSYVFLNSASSGTCWMLNVVSAKESVRARYFPWALSPVWRGECVWKGGVVRPDDRIA